MPFECLQVIVFSYVMSVGRPNTKLLSTFRGWHASRLTVKLIYQQKSEGMMPLGCLCLVINDRTKWGWY